MALHVCCDGKRCCRDAAVVGPNGKMDMHAVFVAWMMSDVGSSACT